MNDPWKVESYLKDSRHDGVKATNKKVKLRGIYKKSKVWSRKALKSLHRIYLMGKY